MSPSLFNNENNIPPSSLAQSSKEISRQARKAKRALRRRIKPEQHRCGDRIKGPGPLFEQQSRGVPRLPRGGDGLAQVSLRPSLPLQYSLGTLASSVGQPQRPATSTSHGLRAETSRFLENPPCSRSVSAPPAISGAGRQDRRTSQRCGTGGSFEAVVHEHDRTLLLLPVSPDTNDGFKTPLPPSKDSKRRGQSCSEGRARLIRDTSLEDKIFQKHQEQYGVVIDGEKIEVDSFPKSAPKADDLISQAGHQDDVDTMSNDANAFVSSCQSPFDVISCLDERKGEERDPTDMDVGCASEKTLQMPDSPLEQGRAARVMLSSTIALSPRGRCKTPTLPTDRHHSPNDECNHLYSPRRTRADGNGKKAQRWPMTPGTPLVDYWLYSEFGRRAESEVNSVWSFGASRVLNFTKSSPFIAVLRLEQLVNPSARATMAANIGT